jgi:hypothetical protein
MIPYLLPLLALAMFRSGLPDNLSDDAYISFSVARHLATRGGGWAVNPSEGSLYVFTSPLWILLLAALRAVVHDVLLGARILGTLSEALLLLAVVRFGNSLRAESKIGTIAAILLCTNPVFLLTSMSGMELPLYLLLVVWCAHLLSRDEPAAGLLAAAGAAWVRFDGILLYLTALAWVLGFRRRAIASRGKSIPRLVLPSMAVLAGYFAFGLLVFGQPIPASVLRKSQMAAGLFSTSWLTGAWVTGKEFLNAFVGKSAYWYTADSVLPVCIPPLLVGLWCMVRRRAAGVMPIVAFTALYATVFVGSGSAYARNFPWYFAPVLPAAYLVTGIGCAQLWAAARGRVRWLARVGQGPIAGIVLAVAWVTAMTFGPISRDVRTLTLVNGERERGYASAAIWAGMHLDRDAVVAANEIGAVRFFLPADMSVLDMFGLLRRREEAWTPYVELLARRRPALVFTRQQFAYHPGIETAMPGAYEWHRFRSLDIGIRTDLAPALRPRLAELPSIYAAVETQREPVSSSSAE